LARLRERMAAQREAMEKLISVNEAQHKIVARFQSTFDSSLAARERQRVPTSVSPAWHQAERELGTSFDALMMVATARPDADGEQGVATWIALLGKRAQRYAQAHESTAALVPQTDTREHLTQSYGDRSELGILAAQLMELARAELSAVRDYALAYSDIHAQLTERGADAMFPDKTSGMPRTTVLDPKTVNRVLVIAIGVAFVTIAVFVVIRRRKRQQAASSNNSTTAAGREQSHATPQAHAGDEADSIATAFQQITDRLDDVTLTVNYLGDIISSLSIGLLVIDDSGRVRMANPAFRTMVGFAPEGGSEDRLIGMQMTALFEQDDRKRRRLPDVRGTGIETRLKSQDGNDLPVMLVSTPLPESDPIKGTVCAIIDLSERKLAEEHVRAGRERIESLVQHLHEIQELERSRIARDLHDDLGAVLTALRNGLVRLCGLVGAEAGAATNDLVALADKANVSVDRVIKNLWPQMLDHFGLGGALEALGAEFENTHGIVTTCSVETGQTRFDRRVELALYRMSQEALTNIARHAHARSAHISLVNRGFETVLEISDDGHGFVKRNREDREGGYGLLGMRQRIAGVSGEISVETGVKGSKITVTVPLTSDESGATAAEFPDIPEGQTNDQSSTG
jgi:PAS domain S-box-containing protein